MTYNVDPFEPVAGADGPPLAPAAVVGIGASAGGLKALQHFFASVPVDSGMAYVVIMHLDPERESRIAELLQDRTDLQVTQVTGETTVEANHIYVIPPEHDLAMAGVTIQVHDRGGRPHHTPVDLFLRTLAEAYGADAIGVVLSGTGADGTVGIGVIKEHGGITVAQDPTEAEYEGMPASAIATGQIDLVLPVAQIPVELVRLRNMPSSLNAKTPPTDTEAQLALVFAALRGKTGHDFRLYKRSMVLRRLDRRLRFAGVSTLEEYLPLLRESETEFGALLRDLLISVSGFFRDSEAFRALGGAIPALFEGKGSSDTVRVWVVGCATGEEAYSVAVLLNEHAATLKNPPRIQIFATDIDENAYSWGRDGLYPASGVGEISPERLRRFFTQEAGHYRVAKKLREGVLFAVHNVLHDAPFSRLDLISCRNLLIYLQPEAQAQVLETFHYGLRPGGLLLLGKAESVGDNRHFTPISEPQRLYRREATRHPGLPRLSAADPSPRTYGPSAGASGSGGDTPSRHFSYGELHLRMLEAYGPPSLIVDEGLNVVHRSDGAGRYLHLGGGEPSHNLIDLSRRDLRSDVRTALHQAFKMGVSSTGRVHVDGADGRGVRLQVYPPMEKDEGARRFALVLFEEEEQPESATAATDDPSYRDAVASLDEELRQKKEQIEATSAAYERTVEELQSAIEELQSVNEEQKAAAEELETSREEIQSMNEELTTINQEHQNTIEELKRTNADLQNLIESTEIATIFLDSAMRVRRFTPAASELFNFVPTDQGRPLAHITHGLDYPALVEEAQRVLTSLVRIEREVSSDAGEWYVVRINPYRSVDGGIDGAIITFFNSTTHKRVDEELREAKVVAESANLAKGNFLATLSHEFRTPLNGMLGYVDLLELDGPLTAAQERKVERVKAGIWHLNAMIDEILAFAKMDDGRASVRSEQFDARVIASEAKTLVEPQASAKGLVFDLVLPDDAVALDTDGGKVRQILINLCGNAVKYTERGEISLRVRRDEELVVFEVRDTGIGVAPEHQARIFDRFWQVDSASTRSFDGMGIGLAAAREFSRLLGGDVEIESVVGRGSTFRLWLPRKNEVG